MGRQINFYMDLEKEKKLIEYLMEQQLIIFSSPNKCNNINNYMLYKDLYITLNEKCFRELSKNIKEDNFYIDVYVSNVIEYMRTRIDINQKSISYGRLYIVTSYFDNNSKLIYKDYELVKVYEKLVRWIRKNCPMTEYIQNNKLKRAYMSSGIKELVEKEEYKLFW